jgi:hypothetical protein
LRHQRPSSRTFGTAIALIAVLLLGLVQTGTGQDALASLGLRSDKNGFTELSFARPAELPARVPRTGEEPRTPFIVHNVEGRARGYEWVVERQDGAQRRVVGRGATGILASGGTAYVNPPLSGGCTGEHVTTVVRLVGVAQTIDFRSRCAKAAS